MDNITREYYSTADFAVSRMIEFIKGFEATEDYAAKAQELFPGLVHEGNTMFLYYFDLVRCYRNLGYEPDLSRSETLALFLSVYIGLLGNSDTTYDMLGTSEAIGSAVFSNAIGLITEQLPMIPDDYGFLFSKVLEALPGHEDDEKHYCVLLYRICSVVAKADGTISPEESRWLAQLLKISEGKKDAAGEDDAREKAAADKAQAHFSRKITEDSIKDSAAIRELDGLIGLEKVKAEVRTLANFAIVQRKRRDMGLKATPVSMHFVFSGNPGTGKTTVARIMGRIYKDLGLLETGHLIEADRAALVAEYVGQTAVKTNRVIDSAMGGVLFIDEAYSLVRQSKEDYGAEAIATLLKRMEDSRDNLAVILAGYTDRMDEFISSNPGLNSRFSRKILFEDYSADDLYSIYEIQLGKYDYRITGEAAEKVRGVIADIVARKPSDFGNGRFARNLFERTIESQANRVAFLADADEKTLCTIEIEDVEGL